MNKFSNKLAVLAEILAFDNRWPLLTEALIGPKSLRVYRLDGVEAVADHRTGDHLGGLRTALVSGEYRRLLDQIEVPTLRSVLDLGAHIGSFILLLKILGAPLVRVLCVEPDPRSRQKLRFNLQHNGIAADIFEGAVSDKAGTAALHRGLLSTGSSLLPDCPNLGSETIEVQAATLDMLVEQYFPRDVLDLCKLDVEGAEFDILLGEHSRSLNRCRYVVCEIHNTLQHSSGQLVEALRRKGFALQPAGGIDHETFLFKNEQIGQASALTYCHK